ncbi:MAG: hypothetical protein J5639_07720 [Bacteroidales bacterium]|nr:hypothetical protein [Bacteroidales bacterium]MBR5704308.1 hypothetical protein [Bacteroidales bacterium]
MELKPNKDWTDAIRESYPSEVDAPDAAGWEAIERRLHRSVVLRRSAIAAAIAAAVLLPLSVLLIRSPWQQSLPPTENNVAQNGSSPVIPPSGEASGDTIFIAAADSPEDVTQAVSFPDVATWDADTDSDLLRDSRPLDRRSANAGQSGLSDQSAQPALPDYSDRAEDPSDALQPSQPAETDVSSPDSTARKTETPADKPVVRQIQEIVPEDLLAFAEDEAQQRRSRKVSVGVSAGAGAIQRNMSFNSMSAPYYAKLAYMNTAQTNELTGLISADNINSYFTGLLTKGANKANMPNPYTPSDVLYVHDLPLSFGLLAQISLLPWLGVESGIEYTYLHSVADSYTGTLDQRLHFIGVPVRMDARIWSNNSFEVYAGLGGKVDKCVSANLGQIRCDEPRLQWSVEAAGGIQYRLWDHLSLYFQPELSLYLTQTDLITYRTEHPLCFALAAGLRYDL